MNAPKFCLMLLLIGSLQSCSLSFNNADTHGTATDLIDSEPKEEATVSPDITIPVKAI